MEDERARVGRAGLGGLDLGDEEGVVSGGVLAGHASAQPCGGAVELRRPGGGAEGDALPERDRRHPAREVLGEVLLSRGQDADRELVGVAQQLVERRVAPDREPDERRLE